MLHFVEKRCVSTNCSGISRSVPSSILNGSRRLWAFDPQLEVITTPTRHADPNGFGAGVGLVFCFKDGWLPNIGITGDTGWFEIEQAHGKGSGENLGMIFNRHFPEVMVLHVGSLKSQELRDSTFYKTHLGARGVFQCVTTITGCRLAILSEFGEECRGYRAWYSKRIEEHFRAGRPDFRCFPSDRETRIVATEKGLFVGFGKTGNVAPYEEVEVQEKSGKIEFYTRKMDKPSGSHGHPVNLAHKIQEKESKRPLGPAKNRGGKR